MRITKSHLRKLIKEELDETLKEGWWPFGKKAEPEPEPEPEPDPEPEPEPEDDGTYFGDTESYYRGQELGREHARHGRPWPKFNTWDKDIHPDDKEWPERHLIRNKLKIVVPHKLTAAQIGFKHGFDQ